MLVTKIKLVKTGSKGGGREGSLNYVRQCHYWSILSFD